MQKQKVFINIHELTLVPLFFRSSGSSRNQNSSGEGPRAVKNGDLYRSRGWGNSKPQGY